MQRVRFLNREKIVERLSKLALKARKKDKNIKKIILFGSLVNDDYTPRSDADLLIILKESKLRFMDRIPELVFYFLDAPISVDIFPYTEKEIEEVPLAKKAISKGLVLADE
jgi:predicted nucleotidyltransferase